MRHLLLSAASAAVLLSACAATPKSTLGIAQGAPELGEWGVETQNISATTAPGDDFFEYINEGWLASAEPPPGLPYAGSFIDLYLLSQQRVRAIIEEVAATDAAPGSNEQLIGDYYASWMNADAIEAKGLAPFQPRLDAIAAASTTEDLARLFAEQGQPSPIGWNVNRDDKNPSRYVLKFGQAGLSLPSRDYYLEDTEEYRDIRDAFLAHVARMFTLAGYDDVDARAAVVLDLETELARVHWTPVQQRDAEATYNIVTREALIASTPEFPWATLLTAMGVENEADFNLDEKSAIEDSARLIAERPISEWRDYLAYQFLAANANMMPHAFDQEAFDFYGRTLQGTDEQQERWRRGVNLVGGQGSLGEAVGQIYVARHFPPGHRAQMEELVGYLERALQKRIGALDWMDDETKARALEKLDQFGLKIGYPDRWRDFAGLDIDPDDLFGNAMRVADSTWADQRARLGSEPWTWEWGMPPQTVNAYYSPTRNEIVFPAAILQPPFFDPNADPAVNFGAIGAAIGHEIGHGFDDQGSRYAGDGMLRNWWTDASSEAFGERTATLVAQYNAFSPLDGLNVNGELTLGENIGDLGGLSMAYEAYHMYLADHGLDDGPTIDGYTGDQRFFMSWAQCWRSVMNDGFLRQLVLSDPHSPARYRVNGVVRNMDAWYAAFDVAPGAALFLDPKDRVGVW